MCIRDRARMVSPGMGGRPPVMMRRGSPAVWASMVVMRVQWSGVCQFIALPLFIVRAGGMNPRGCGQQVVHASIVGLARDHVSVCRLACSQHLLQDVGSGEYYNGRLFDRPPFRYLPEIEAATGRRVKNETGL